jgi:hypothetical protein
MHKRMYFPIFPLLDQSSLHSFNQPIMLQTCPTVPTSPNDQKTLLWTTSNWFVPLNLIAHTQNHF